MIQQIHQLKDKLNELKERHRKVVAENKELKKERKTVNDEVKALRKETKELKDTVSLKEKSIIGLHEKLELARVNEIRLHAKIELLESMTTSKEVGMNVVESETMDRYAEKISRIKELEDEVRAKDNSVEEGSRNIEKLNQELTKTKDTLAEKDMYINNVDRMYAETIDAKNKVIQHLTRITNADDELALGFKRILIKTLAEKELKNIKELYLDMKCTNISTQTTPVSQPTAQTTKMDKKTKKNDFQSDNSVLATKNNKHVVDIALDEIPPLEEVAMSESNSSVSPVVPQRREDESEIVTLRVLNLPHDMDVLAIESLFNVNRTKKLCFVELSKITNYRVIVKIVAPRNIADGILKYHNTFLHKRKIRVFVVEKCRLGNDCKRKVCRFGHGERYNLLASGVDSASDDAIINKGNGHQNISSVDISGCHELNGGSTEETLWMIKNLPDKMNTVGILRLIRSFGVVVQEKRNEYQVLSINSYKVNDDNKVEAVLLMPEEMGQRLLSHNGELVGNCTVEIVRTKLFRFGKKCQNSKNCSFYHKAIVDTGKKPVASTERVQPPLCWFKNSCPFGDVCKFGHPEKELQNCENITSGTCAKNC